MTQRGFGASHRSAAQLGQWTNLEGPTKEHLRESHREERLQSSPSDRMEAWGIVVALVLAPIVYLNWGALPVAAAVAGVLAAVLLGSSVISLAWKKLVKRRRETEG